MRTDKRTIQIFVTCEGEVKCNYIYRGVNTVHVLGLGLIIPRGFQLSWGQPLHFCDVCSSRRFNVKVGS